MDNCVFAYLFLQYARHLTDALRKEHRSKVESVGYPGVEILLIKML